MGQPLPTKGQLPQTHHELVADAGERERHFSRTSPSPVRPCRSSLSTRLGVTATSASVVAFRASFASDSPCFWSYLRMSCTTFGRSAMLELYRSCSENALVAPGRGGALTATAAQLTVSSSLSAKSSPRARSVCMSDSSRSIAAAWAKTSPSMSSDEGPATERGASLVTAEGAEAGSCRAESHERRRNRQDCAEKKKSIPHSWSGRCLSGLAILRATTRRSPHQ
jgi:hypothetical protein